MRVLLAAALALSTVPLAACASVHPDDRDWEIVLAHPDRDPPPHAVQPYNQRQGVVHVGQDYGQARPRPGDPRYKVRKTFDCGHGGSACELELQLYFTAKDGGEAVDGEKATVTLTAGGQSTAVEIPGTIPTWNLYRFTAPGCGDVTVEVEFTDEGRTPGIQSEIVHLLLYSYGCR